MRVISYLVPGLLFAAPISAQTMLLHRSATWEVVRTTSDRGRAICSVVLNGSRVGAGSLVFKHAAGDEFVMAQIFRESWRIPQNAEVSVGFMVDRASMGIWQAEIMPPYGLAWSYPLTRWRHTVGNILSNGTMARVQFMNGTEREWAIPLLGSRAAISAFHGCAAVLGTDLSPVQ